MNATIHSELSAKNWGGSPEIYYPIHDFMDRSKEVEPTNKHRFFTHQMWFVKRVIIPIFGHSIKNSENRNVNLKDLLETDHLLADFRGKFIPTINDYLATVKDQEDDEEKLMTFRKENQYLFNIPKVRELLDSPIGISGRLVSLYLTYNSWFLVEILPKIFPEISIYIKNFSIAPDGGIMNRITYQSWMNGDGLPPSMNSTFPKIEPFAKISEEIQLIPESEQIFIDGAREQINRQKEMLTKTYDGKRGLPEMID